MIELQRDYGAVQKLALELAQVGVWHLDLPSYSLSASPQCKANFGLAPDDELSYDRARELIHPGDRERMQEAVESALESGGTYDITYRVVWPDGSLHWVHARGAVRGEQMVGVTQNADDRIRAEEAIAEGEDLMRSIVALVAEGLCVIDPEGRLTYMNPAAERILGWRSDEVRGRILHDTVHHMRPDGSPYPRRECPLVRSITAGETVAGHEDVWLHRDGTFVPIVCSATPLARDGEARGSVLSLHDRREARDREQKLREANVAKDQFLAAVSHELRTPLTAMIGWIEMLRAGVESTDALDQMEMSARTLAAIVDDLLDVARSTRGSLDLELQQFDLCAAIEEALAVVHGAAQARDLTISVQRPEGGAIVTADPRRLRQVFWNLLSNAVKFTPPSGAIQVRIEEEGGSLRAVVSDSGVGIDPDFLPRVFEKFTQGAQKKGGLGLGLSITRELVRLHGGEIDVLSEGEGKGTTVCVTLPREANAEKQG